MQPTKASGLMGHTLTRKRSRVITGACRLDTIVVFISVLKSYHCLRLYYHYSQWSHRNVAPLFQQCELKNSLKKLDELKQIFELKTLERKYKTKYGERPNISFRMRETKD